MGENINTEVLHGKAIQTIVESLKVLNTDLDKQMKEYASTHTTELETQIFDLRDRIRELEDKLYKFIPHT